MPTQPVSMPVQDKLPVAQQISSVLWPSFLTASLATILFFTAFDPEQLSLIWGGPQFTRMGGYTVGFFLFWLLTAVSSALTCYFRRPCPPRKTGETSDSPAAEE